MIANGACGRGARRDARAPRGHASASPPHANRAHLAAREEGLDRSVLIVPGVVGRRAAVLQCGHAEGDGGGARGSSAAKRTAGERRTRRWRSKRARAPPSRHRCWRWRRTLVVALAASGYAARSACTTASDELFAAARWRGVSLSCTWHTRRAGGRLSDEAGGGWGRGRMRAAHRAGGGVHCPSPWRPPGTPRAAPAPLTPMCCT